MGFANYARAALERFKCVSLSLVGSGKEDDELGLVSGERRRRREIEARNILTHVRNNQLIWGRTQNEIFWRLGVGQMINVQVEWNKSMRGEKKKSPSRLFYHFTQGLLAGNAYTRHANVLDDQI